MIRLPHRNHVIAAVALLILAGCAPADDLPSTTPSASATASASASAGGSSGASPSAPGSPSPSASGSPSAGTSGDFTIPANAAADALFIDRDRCANPDGGYQLAFPDAWFTNTAVGDVNACSWFSPTSFEVDDPSATPDEVAIEIFIVDGLRIYPEDPTSRQEGILGATQPAVRVEVAGDAGETMYEYVIGLGPTAEGGPNLVVHTDTAMGGDYELNKAVLDRMMTTIEFTGTID